MEQNKFKKVFLLTHICFLLFTGCQIDLIEDSEYIFNKIEFGLSVNDAFKQKINKIFYPR